MADPKLDVVNPNPIRANNILIAAGLCVVGAGAFKAMVALNGGEPGPSSASAAAVGEPGTPMGTLVGRDRTVELVSTLSGTRYTVRAKTGEVLAAGLTASEAAAYLGVDPRRLEAGQALMLADDKGEPGR